MVSSCPSRDSSVSALSHTRIFLRQGRGLVTSAGKIKLKWTDGNLEVEISTDVEQRLCLGVQCILFDLLLGRQSISKETESMVIIGSSGAMSLFRGTGYSPGLY